MALSSPGVQVNIIDESQYLPAAPNSIPLVVIATAQNKVNAAGTGVATATTKANAGKLYQITSQRDLITYYGNPFFYKTTNGTSIHGYELNEYGLLAAYSVLGSTNLIYAIRADIDLAALVGKTGRPSSQPDNGSWWVDTANSTWGIFEFDSTTGSFTNKKPVVITDSAKLNGGVPLDSVAPIGSYAVNLAVDNSAEPTSFYTYWYRSATQGWVAVGSAQWRGVWPTVQGTKSNPTITTGGDFVFTRGFTTANVVATISDGISTDVAGDIMYVSQVTNSAVDLAVGTLIVGEGIEEGTYIKSMTGTYKGPAGTGGVGYYTVSKSQLVMPVQAVFSGSISGTTLTVSSVTSGALAVGDALSGSTTKSIWSQLLGAPTSYRVKDINYTAFETLLDTAQTVDTSKNSLAGYGLSEYTIRSAGAKMIVTAVVDGDEGLLPGRKVSAKLGTSGTLVGDTTGKKSGTVLEQSHYLSGTIVSNGAIATGNTTFTMRTNGTGLTVAQLNALAADGRLCIVRGNLTASGTETTGMNGLAKITATNLSKIDSIDATSLVVTIDNNATTGFGSLGTGGNAQPSTGDETFTIFVKCKAPNSVTATGQYDSDTLTLSGAFDTDWLVAGAKIAGKGILGGTTLDATTPYTTANGVTTIKLSSKLQEHGTGTYTIHSGTSGGLGLYKVSLGTDLVSSTAQNIIAQPTPGTVVFIDQAASLPGTESLSQGTVVQDILPGTYIYSLGTGTGGTGTYTLRVNAGTGLQTQAITTTFTAHAKSMTAQFGIKIDVTAGESVADIATSINALSIPGITAVADASVSQKLSIYYAKADTATVNRVMNVTGDETLLAELGLTANDYYAPSIAYGTNASQPLWKSTDATPRPTGSVWIKTNAYNSGLDIVLGQYSTASAAYTSKKITVATSDAVAINALDSTGGQAIPLNSVYLQVPAAPGSGPSRLFYRAATGKSVFTGTVSEPTGFVVGSVLDVQVTLPGTDVVSDTYRVTIASGTTPAGTAIATASDFIDAWHASTLNGVATAIPYTDVSIDSATGALIITHSEGGSISLDDSANDTLGYVSPLSIAGFSAYDLTNSTGTVGGKHGAYKALTYTGLTTTGGSGTGLTVNVTTTGFVPLYSINSAGTNYNVGDIVTVNGLTGHDNATMTVKINQVDTTTGVTAGAAQIIEQFTGDSKPEFKLILSNWEPFLFTADDTAPVADPVDGTPWFYSVINQVDIMVNVGGVWKGLLNTAYDSSGSATGAAPAGNNYSGIMVSASEPATQVDGTPLVYGDLWLDSGDLENYPVIYRWQLVSGVKQWVLIDNTDQTTENGILFADARWGKDGTIDPVNDKIPTIGSLLTSDYIDLDCPDATGYPQGMLLFNTRRSGYNVKKFQKNYFNGIDFPDMVLPTQTDAWVTASGLKSNGSPYMGRKAQRAMVVQAIKALLDTSSELRDDQTSYNLIVTPGYAEAQPNMVALNNDRNNTAYIIGDTPLRLPAEANAITQWASNSKGATGTGDDGLVTRDTYLGIYYPSGITTDLTGAEVVVPASHMMLRTMIHNDNVAYPWFAPAGMRRGTVDNATNIGYIDAASGEFQTTQNRVALRDIEYTNMINPIAFFRNIGLLNYGNKNSYDSQSALDRTNVARLICYIRDRLQIAVRPFLFEPNDARTRDQVKAVILTLMADIKTKRGIYDYLVVCDESNNTPARIDRNELWIDIAIEPVKAIEFIYIPVRVLNTGEIAKLG